jgi:hypothetical protein
MKYLVDFKTFLNLFSILEIRFFFLILKDQFFF